MPVCGDGETVWSVESDGDAEHAVLLIAELRACNRESDELVGPATSAAVALLNVMDPVESDVEAGDVVLSITKLRACNRESGGLAGPATSAAVALLNVIDPEVNVSEFEHGGSLRACWSSGLLLLTCFVLLELELLEESFIGLAFLLYHFDCFSF